MKITVIGAGSIGGTLGSKWATQGHQVIFGVRDPQALRVQSLLKNIGNRASANLLPHAVTEAEAVLFAVPGSAMKETVAPLGSQLNGKILIDATNSIGQSPMHQLQLLGKAAPDSPLYRAFSNLGWENFADPEIDGVQVDLFYCGDSGSGQAAVDRLIADIGLRPVYIGGPDKVDIIDALTRLWFVLAMEQRRGRHLALKLHAG